MQIIKGKTPKTWAVVLYGTPGVGKSSIATYAPRPIFIDCEGGLDRIECERTPRVTTYAEFYEALQWAYKSDYKTVVIDTLLAVEEMLTQKILAELNKDRTPETYVTSLSDKDRALSYGTGFEMLKANWALVVKILFKLKDSGKNILCIAHEQLEKVENPEGDNWDRYTLNVHKKSVPMIISKMDAVFYAHYDKVLKTKDGTGKKIALSTGTRSLQTRERPHAVAKNRFDLEESIGFTTPDEAKQFFTRLT